MNQAKIWLVVLPECRPAADVGRRGRTALLVHAAILSHTTWVRRLLQGGHQEVAAIET